VNLHDHRAIEFQIGREAGQRRPSVRPASFAPLADRFGATAFVAGAFHFDQLAAYASVFEHKFCKVSVMVILFF
jgi:hypothetical protein